MTDTAQILYDKAQRDLIGLKEEAEEGEEISPESIVHAEEVLRNAEAVLADQLIDIKTFELKDLVGRTIEIKAYVENGCECIMARDIETDQILVLSVENNNVLKSKLPTQEDRRSLREAVENQEFIEMPDLIIGELLDAIEALEILNER